MHLKNRKKFTIVILGGMLLLGAGCNTKQNKIPSNGSPTPTLWAETTPTQFPKASPSGTFVPTQQPNLTKEPEEEQVPTPSPTSALTPEPTKEAESTSTPIPSATQKPEPTPTPVPDMDWLLQNGWQRTVDVTEHYNIYFPECFDEAEVERTEQEIILSYSSKKQTQIRFVIHYRIGQTISEALEQLYAADAIVTEPAEKEKEFSYRVERDIIQQGVILETCFINTLLGSSLEEEEAVVGTIQIQLEYPKEDSTEYETEEYQYFWIPIL